MYIYIYVYIYIYIYLCARFCRCVRPSANRNNINEIGRIRRVAQTLWPKPYGPNLIYANKYNMVTARPNRAY